MRDGVFLFTDIVDSTPRWESAPDEMRVALPLHDHALGEAFSAAGGDVVKHTGDGMLVVFDDADLAVAAAVDAQRRLDELFTESEPLRVRMGLDCGSATPHGRDYIGPVLNRAARVMSTAHGGQIIVTDDVRTRCRQPNVSFSDRGRHRLKGIASAVHLFEVLHDGAPTGSEPLRSLNPSTGKLPVVSSSLVGRDDELARVTAALEASSIVTLLGPGGVGKTRLALEIGRSAADRYPDGRWFVDLAQVDTDSDVGEIVAESLGVQRRLGESWAETVHQALDPLTALLIIDNCEHLLEATGALIEGLSGTTLRVLATSRVPLQIAGERRVRIDPLDRTAAMTLFAERAAAIDDRLVSRPGFDDSCREICDRLDGLPLALELAAARLETLSVEAIAERLTADIGLVSSSAPALSDRQRALSATLEWSAGLLTPAERQLFLNCSTFHGSFALEAVEAITDPGAGPSTLDLLDRLVQQSMLLRTEDGSGAHSRFRLLRPVADYAATQLSPTEHTGLQERGAAHFRGLAAEAARHLLSDAEPQWIADLDADRANLHRAFEWYADADPPTAIQMAVDLYSLWIDHDLLHEGLRWLALPCDEPSDTVLRARGYSAILAFFLGQNADAVMHAASARALASTLGCPPPAPVAVVEASIRLNQLDVEGALALCDETRRVCGDAETPDDATALSAIAAVASLARPDADAVDLARFAAERSRRFGPGRTVSALVNLAFTLQRDQPAEARAVSTDAIGLAGELGSRYFEAFAQLQLGLAARTLGERDEALYAFLAALRLQRQVGLRNEAATAIEQIARYAADPLPEDAVSLFAAATRLREAVALDGVPAAQRARTRSIDGLRGRMDEAAFAQAWTTGYDRTLDEAAEAVALAVDALVGNP